MGVPETKRIEASIVSHGVAEAGRLARSGRLISAIKYLEAANPGLTREKAKAIVHAFGYDGESAPKEFDRHALRRL